MPVMLMQGMNTHSYDAVLVAVPLELANLTITCVEHRALPVRQYQRTVTTLVKGRLRPSYFGVQEVPKGTSLALRAVWFICTYCNLCRLFLAAPTEQHPMPLSPYGMELLLARHKRCNALSLGESLCKIVNSGCRGVCDGDREQHSALLCDRAAAGAARHPQSVQALFQAASI